MFADRALPVDREAMGMRRIAGRVRELLACIVAYWINSVVVYTTLQGEYTVLTNCCQYGFAKIDKITKRFVDSDGNSGPAP